VQLDDWLSSFHLRVGACGGSFTVAGSTRCMCDQSGPP